ncbi:hypothetical protein SDC9_198228 [bioreactor metagenome]|uniref:Uncharacterized protein n=1 Tax=bioreactor metagenome TaxID=1076179 RepID=A0A645IH29_9ZZZZ
MRANSGRIRMSDFHALTVQDLRVRTGYWVLSEVSAADARSRIANVTLDRASLTLENVDGIDWNGVTILDAPETALTLKTCRNISFEDLSLTRPNRKNAENCRALWIDQCETLTVSGLAVELDSRRVMPLDLSGGALKIAGALKAPPEFYTPDTLLRLPSEPASGHPQVDLEITAVLGEKSFEL